MTPEQLTHLQAHQAEFDDFYTEHKPIADYVKEHNHIDDLYASLCSDLDLTPIQTHVLLYNGYGTSQERLFEDVMFEVTIVEQDGDLTIAKVAAPTEGPSAHYLRNVTVKPSLLKEIRKNVQENIDHLRKVAKSEGKTVSDLLDEFFQDEGGNQPRIELLNEV